MLHSEKSDSFSFCCVLIQIDTETQTWYICTCSRALYTSLKLEANYN